MIEKFKEFFAGKKEKEMKTVTFNAAIEIMKGEEMFAKHIWLVENNGAVEKVFKKPSKGTKVVGEYYENSTYYNMMLNLIYKSGIKNIIKLMNADLNTLNRDEVEHHVLSVADASTSYNWLKAGFGKATFNDFENIVLKEQNPGVSLAFAKDVKGANVKEHSKVIFDKGSAACSKMFAQIVNFDTYEHLKKYIDYMVKYVYGNKETIDQEDFKDIFENIFVPGKVWVEYPNELAENNAKNNAVREYMKNYTEAMIKRHQLDAVSADDMIIL